MGKKNPLPKAIPVCGLKLAITKPISHTFIYLVCKAVGYGESYFYTKQPYLPVPLINTNCVSYFHHRHGKITIPCRPVETIGGVCWELCNLLVFVKQIPASFCVSYFLYFSDKPFAQIVK